MDEVKVVPQQTITASDFQMPKDSSGAAPVDSQERLAWDVSIESPPPRASGKVRAKLKYGGRSKPIPVIEDETQDG